MSPVATHPSRCGLDVKALNSKMTINQGSNLLYLKCDITASEFNSTTH